MKATLGATKIVAMSDVKALAQVKAPTLAKALTTANATATANTTAIAMIDTDTDEAAADASDEPPDEALTVLNTTTFGNTTLDGKGETPLPSMGETPTTALAEREIPRSTSY